jgi:hypothetical protein
MKKLFVLLFCFYLFAANAQTKLPDLIPYFSKGKWGYCDKNMKIVIPCRYDQAYPFYEERALVITYTNDTILPYTIASFIDPSGRVVFRLNSSAMGSPASRFQDGVALIENYNIPEYGDLRTLSVVDRNGKVLQQIDSCGLDMELSMFYEYGIPFNSDGVYVTTIGFFEQNIVIIYKDGRKPVILKYDYAGPFKNGYSMAVKAYKEGQEIPDAALINTKGEEVIPPGRFNLSLEYSNIGKNEIQLYPYSEKNRYGYVNLKGEVVIPPTFDMAQTFSEGLAIVGIITDIDEYEIPTYQFGYINTKGDLIIPYQFDFAFPFLEGLAEVIRNDSILFINISNKVELGFQNTPSSADLEFGSYKYGAYFYDHGFKNGQAILYQNDKIAWINRKGEFIIPPLYIGLGRIGPSMVVENFENGITKVTPNNSLIYNEYYIDEEGRPYFDGQPMILPDNNKTITRYAAPSRSMPLDTLELNSVPVVKKYMGKKDKVNGKKGEWIEIENWSGPAYVFSADFNTRAVKTMKTKGTGLYKNPNDKSAVVLLAPNAIIFIDAKEKASKIGSKKWVKVTFFGTLDTDIDAYDYTQYTLYVKGDEIQLMPKE